MVWKLLWAILAVTLTSGGLAMMTSTAPIKLLDTIQGGNFLAIQSAMTVFERQHADLRQYKIEVFREDDSVMVVFTKQNSGASGQSKIGVRSGAATEITAAALQQLLADTARVKLLDTIQGGSFLAIQSAMTAFHRHYPDLAKYKIEVLREGDAVIVIFTDKDAPVGGRGNLGARPGFEVEMNARDLKVLRSNFVR